MASELTLVACNQCGQEFLIPKAEIDQVELVAKKMGIVGEILCDSCFNEPELPFEMVH